MLKMLKNSHIRTDGLFLNADAGFDTSELRKHLAKNEIFANIDQNSRNGSLKDYLFDEMHYKFRFVIERTNAWLDAFKSILIRFETNSVHLKSLVLLAFSIILHRKL